MDEDKNNFVGTTFRGKDILNNGDMINFDHSTSFYGYKIVNDVNPREVMEDPIYKVTAVDDKTHTVTLEKIAND